MKQTQQRLRKHFRQQLCSRWGAEQLEPSPVMAFHDDRPADLTAVYLTGIYFLFVCRKFQNNKIWFIKWQWFAEGGTVIHSSKACMLHSPKVSEFNRSHYINLNLYCTYSYCATYSLLSQRLHTPSCVFRTIPPLPFKRCTAPLTFKQIIYIVAYFYCLLLRLLWPSHRGKFLWCENLHGEKPILLPDW